MDCTIENRKHIPLSKVVKASIADMFDDIGKSEERASYFTSRGLKKLYREVLPKFNHKALLVVNKNTHTATLPHDFNFETFVGFIDSRWRKVPLPLNNRLVDSKNISDIPCEDACPKCNQDKAICNDLVVTEEVNLIVINNSTYEQTIVKKLYPNGDYYLESTTPVLNIDTNAVDYVKKKEFIVNFDLKPCGCLETNAANTANLQTYCPDIYCNYYAPCDTKCCTDYGGYKVFEESGLIQFDSRYPFDKCYIEYSGFIVKKNGQYYVPEVAFETLVEWTKFKFIDGKKNSTLGDKNWRWERYTTERKDMERVLGRFPLSYFIEVLTRLPKFDLTINTGCDWYGNFTPNADISLNRSGNSNGSGTGGNGGNNSTIINNYPTTIINHGSYTLSLKVDGNPGSPVAGQSRYQNNLLKGATDINWIFVAKQTFTIKDEDFIFNSTDGYIDISPNEFFTGDSLIIPYNKNS